jgi:hypothetical protein
LHPKLPLILFIWSKEKHKDNVQEGKNMPKKNNAQPYVPVNQINVYLWGKLVGAVALDPTLGYYAFAYNKMFGRIGVADRFGEIRELITEVNEAIRLWPIFAKNAGLAKDTIDRIKKRHILL